MKGIWRSAALRRALLGVLMALGSVPAFAEPPQGIIVKYRGELGQANRLDEAEQRVLAAPAARAGIGLQRQRRLSNGAEVLHVQGRRLTSRELRRTLDEIAADPDVEYAEEDLLMQPLMTPNDPRYNEQWSYYDPTAGLNLPAAWDLSTGAGVVVAVIDTGYRPHADLLSNIVAGYDFMSNAILANDGSGRDSDARDPGDATSAGECGAGSAASNSSWHGTHVAGTIAAVTNNGVGVAGVAYGAKVMPLRVLGKCGGYTSDIADAITWASGASVYSVPANGTPAKVINLSLGGGGACGSTMQNAINTARARGTVIVVAAGNSATDASGSSPANCSGVIVVAATNRSGGRAYYSNYGAIVDVAAPGGAQSYAGDANGILSTLNSGLTAPGGDSYALYQGTSMATPHVAGVAALVLSKNPALTPDQVETLLKSTARAFPASCSQCGAGLVDANAAVIAAAGGNIGSGGGGGGSTGGGTTGGGGSCAAGYTSYTGSLASGGNVYVPASTGYSVAAAGTQLAALTVPATGNFDLYLHKKVNGSWTQVAASASGGIGAGESISYTGNAGTYRLRIIASKGSGAYALCLKTP